MELAYDNSFHSSISMAPYEALYGRRCRSHIGWFEVGETSMLGPDLIYKTLEKVHVIRNRLRMAYSRQKSYANNRRMDLEFEKGDKVKGVVRFCKKGKLIPRYVAPYEILQSFGKVSYDLKLPSKLALVHPVFHVSMHKKFVGDPESIIPIEGLRVNDNLFYEEFLVQIHNKQVRGLRNKEVLSVEVLWRNHLVEGATWKAKADMKSRYPHLFDD